jgi:chemotaxis receptor (MCP) glutamine deamidase CheD
VAEEFGGLVNRTMYLNLATGQLNLKVSGQTEEVALCNR